MKKILVIILVLFTLPACSYFQQSTGVASPSEKEAADIANYKQRVNEWKAEKIKAAKVTPMKNAGEVEIRPLVKGHTSKFLPTKVTPTAFEIEEEVRYKEYKNKYSRLIQNVSIHDKSDTEITYEYNDARVDELAFLAVQYCKEQDKKAAFLQKITLFKNQSRLATFDCRSL